MVWTFGWTRSRQRGSLSQGTASAVPLSVEGRGFNPAIKMSRAALSIAQLLSQHVVSSRPSPSRLSAIGRHRVVLRTHKCLVEEPSRDAIHYAPKPFSCVLVPHAINFMTSKKVAKEIVE